MFSIQQIENSIKELVNSKSFSSDEFIYNLLSCYGIPKASIKRLQSGTYNLSKIPGEVLWKNKVYFKLVNGEDPYLTLNQISKDTQIKKHNPRFLIVFGTDKLLALDTIENETLDIQPKQLDEEYGFFRPWAGMSKAKHHTENLADIKAAEKMARLYDEIRKDNPSTDYQFLYSLNTFFSRLLFCFFAEDTEIFPSKGQFTDAIESYTQTDGSDLIDFFTRLFLKLNTNTKAGFPSYLQNFPYVNGGLFENSIQIPKINQHARRILLECGELNWAKINPDIFGSMIQAVVHQNERAGLGMHYTSVPNILKVIEPLFLNELNEEFEKARDSESKLKKLLARIYEIKIFDPACGSGNFLIIAYKELRRIENRILKQLEHISGSFQLSADITIKIENFYGIEIDHFACEVARLSLWLAKHQMNLEYRDLFGVLIPLIPLTKAGKIVCNNAARIDWHEVCPNNGVDEIYVIGNPPYQGAKLQDEAQKEDFLIAFPNEQLSKNLDYISIWFLKGAEYIANTKAKLAFVSTNSICQGEQVAPLWPRIFNKNLEIGFAHTSFKWSNSAKANAGVTCVIVGLRNQSNQQKFIITDGIKQDVSNINAYLVSAANIIVDQKSKPISDLPHMVFGSMPRDGGHLILNNEDVRNILKIDSNAKKLIKKFVGSHDFINGETRFCLWITDNDYDFAITNNFINHRLDLVKEFREKSVAGSTKEYSNKPHKFVQNAYRQFLSLIIPRHSSENRPYIPIGFLDKNTVIADSALAIYNPETYVFGLISSRMHMTWVKAIGGRLKTDYRYSASLVYNNFPVPTLSEKQKSMINTHVLGVLNARGNHSEMTLGEMYDPDKMPEDLQLAHHGLDQVVDLCYRSRPFDSDDDRLAHLFKLYEEMTKGK